MALENCPSYYDSIQFTLKLSGLRQWQYLFCSRICCLGWGSLVFVLLDFRWAGLKPGDWNHLKSSSFTCLAIDVVSWNLLKLSAETSPYALFLWSELPPDIVTGFWGWALQKRVSQVEAVSSLWPSPRSHRVLLLPYWLEQSQLPARLKGREYGSHLSVGRCWLHCKKYWGIDYVYWCHQFRKKFCQKSWCNCSISVSDDNSPLYSTFIVRFTMENQSVLENPNVFST